MAIFDFLTWDLLTAGCVIYVLNLFYQANYGKKKLPPGPFRWPILGNMNKMAGNMRQSFRKLRQVYGDIFSLQVGSQLFVVVNGYETLKEVFVEKADDFSDRSENYSVKVFTKGKGMASRADVALPLRHMFHRAVNDKDKVDEYIQGQLRLLDDILQKTNTQPFDIEPTLFRINGNILCSLFCGKTFQHSDVEFETGIAAIVESIKLTKASAILDIFPSLLRLPGDVFKTRKIAETGDKLHRFASILIQECKHNPEQCCMIKDYLTAMENSGDPESDQDLIFTVVSMLLAGIQVGSLTWVILHLINHKQLQATLRTEVVNAVGSTAYPSENDRKLLPQCEAFVEEILRYYNVAQFSVPHGTIKDTVLRNYVIPKGAVIVANLDSVMSDTRFFPDYEVFNHERFIGPDGSFVADDKVLPFGIGRRKCLAYKTAKSVLLMVTVLLLQRYELLPAEDGEMPSLEGQLRFTNNPFPFTMRAKRISK